MTHPVGSFFAAFFQAQGFYRLIGVVQVAAALLLLVPRAAPLGAALYLPVIVNVFAITASMGFAGTREVTGLMLLAALYLVAWEYDGWKLLVPGFRAAPAAPDPARDLDAGCVALAATPPLAVFAAAALGLAHRGPAPALAAGAAVAVACGAALGLRRRWHRRVLANRTTPA